jgi:hypothetical protein
MTTIVHTLGRTMPDDLNAPWNLRFERGGTEDIAVISDANDEELLRSRDFWLPEADDPVPPTLAAMRLIVAAPALLAALQGVIEYARNEAFRLESLKDSPETETEAERAWGAVCAAEAVLLSLVSLKVQGALIAEK